MNGTDQDDGPDYAGDEARAHYVTLTLPEETEHDRYEGIVRDIETGRLDVHLGRLDQAIRLRMRHSDWLNPRPR